MMNISDQYTYRVLVQEDIEQIKDLIANSFYTNNIIFNIFKLDLEDNQKLLTNVDWIKIIKEGLSLGIFLDLKLISVSIICDISTNFTINGSVSQRIIEYVEYFTDELIDVKKDVIASRVKTVYLYILSTHPQYCNQKLGITNLQKSAQLAKSMGYKQLMTEAGHIGTIKAINKIFKSPRVIQQLDEIYGIKIDFQQIIVNL